MEFLDPLHIVATVGDTLSSIAEELGVTREQLLIANNWSTGNAAIGKVGSVLHIPYLPALTLGYVAYTDADRAKWVTTNPQYGRLASSWGGRISRGTEPTCQVPANIPTPNSAGSAALVESSVWALCQVLLYQADANELRRTAAIQKIDQLIAMGRVLPSNDEFRLPLGWALSNYVKAMWVIGYDPAKARDFLMWTRQHLDWWGANNWNTLFAAVRISIGGFLEDEPAFQDGIDYLEYIMPRAIWDPLLDDNIVTPLVCFSNRNRPETMWPGKLADTTPDYVATSDCWDNGVTGGQSQLPKTNSIAPPQMLRGANCEDMRDLPHVTFSIFSLADACLAIQANGGTVPPEVHQRLLAFTARHSQRVYDWRTTGSVKSWPTPASAGGEGHRYGWWIIKKYLGQETPAVVDKLLALDEIKTAPAPGFNHEAAEALGFGPA